MPSFGDRRNEISSATKCEFISLGYTGFVLNALLGRFPAAFQRDIEAVLACSEIVLRPSDLRHREPAYHLVVETYFLIPTQRTHDLRLLH